MIGALKMVGGWVAGEGAQGKIKGHRATSGLSPCLHIFFWGTAQNRGVLRFCAKPTLYMGLVGALFVESPKNRDIAVFLSCSDSP